MCSKKKMTNDDDSAKTENHAETMSWRRVGANLADSARAKFETCSEGSVPYID